MDRLTQPALTAGKGRVRGPRSRGAVPLSDGLVANGQPVIHANRQKGRGPNTWLTRGYDLRTITRNFLQAVTQAMRHLANKAAGQEGYHPCSRTVSRLGHKGDRAGGRRNRSTVSHANRQTGVRSAIRQNVQPNGPAHAAPQHGIRQIPQ